MLVVHYDAYEEYCKKKTSELRRTVNKIQEHQKVQRSGMPMTRSTILIFSPALVCLAFSIELHVKLLLHTYDLIVKGHDDRKLLKKLPVEDIAYISNPRIFTLRSKGNSSFENIDKASDLFIRTRYYFTEKMDTLHLTPGFVLRWLKVIRKRVVERAFIWRYNLGFVFRVTGLMSIYLKDSFIWLMAVVFEDSLNSRENSKHYFQWYDVRSTVHHQEKNSTSLSKALLHFIGMSLK